MKKTAGIVIGITLFISLIFGLQYLGLMNFKFFAPKYENVRREVYENTQSYVEAKRQAITKYYNEWRKGDEADKDALRTIVLQDFANFNLDLLTQQQKEWYDQITN